MAHSSAFSHDLKVLSRVEDTRGCDPMACFDYRLSCFVTPLFPRCVTQTQPERAVLGDAVAPLWHRAVDVQAVALPFVQAVVLPLLPLFFTGRLPGRSSTACRCEVAWAACEVGDAVCSSPVYIFFSVSRSNWGAASQAKCTCINSYIYACVHACILSLALQQLEF